MHLKTTSNVILVQPRGNLILTSINECLCQRNIAMLIREPELGYNTENQRQPRGGRAVQRAFYSGSYHNGHTVNSTLAADSSNQRRLTKRDAEEEENSMHSKTYWVDLLNGFAEMTDPISSDLALFLYCMLN